MGYIPFVPCEKGKYTYWLELRHKDAQAQADYEALLQESGMEVLERWFYWIYLRRETAKGPFTLYSDPASKAGQYRRIRGLFLAGLLLELLCFGMEVASALETGEPAFWAFSGLLLAIVFAFARIVYKCTRKIQRLEMGMEQ